MRRKRRQAAAEVTGRTGESVGRPRGRLALRLRGWLMRRPSIRQGITDGVIAAAAPVVVGLILAAVLVGVVIGAALVTAERTEP